LSRNSALLPVEVPEYIKAQEVFVGQNWSGKSSIGREGGISPETLAFIIKGEGNEWPNLETAYGRLGLLRQARAVVEELIRTPQGKITIEIPSIFQSDSKGLIAAESPLLEIFSGIKTNLMRRCSVCSSAFYARRIDQGGCSLDCRNKRNVDAFRTRQKESGAQYSRAYRKRKKKQKR
jgi:hypothetical protein